MVHAEYSISLCSNGVKSDFILLAIAIAVAMFSVVRFFVLSDVRTNRYLRTVSEVNQQEQSFLTAMSRSKQASTFRELLALLSDYRTPEAWNTLRELEKRGLVKQVLFERNLDLLLGWRIPL